MDLSANLNYHSPDLTFLTQYARRSWVGHCHPLRPAVQPRFRFISTGFAWSWTNTIKSLLFWLFDVISLLSSRIFLHPQIAQKEIGKGAGATFTNMFIHTPICTCIYFRAFIDNYMECTTCAFRPTVPQMLTHTDAHNRLPQSIRDSDRKVTCYAANRYA